MLVQDPSYVSKCTARGLWHWYSILDDRIELVTLLGTMTVPFDEIEQVELRDSDLAGWGKHGQSHLKNFRPAVKIDWASFHDHVVLDRSGGLLHRVMFTPEDTEKVFNHPLLRSSVRTSTVLIQGVRNDA